MRAPILAAALGAFLPLAAFAEDDAPNARAAFVERRGLVEADTACRLFIPSIRDALLVGVAQAEGSLLRAGWSSGQVRELEHAVVGAARGRACADTRTISAAAVARNGFSGWVNAGSMEFPGWERSWTARRTNLADGWRLSQSVEAPVAATFGVRDRDGAQHLSLVVPLARGQTLPTSATLALRDPALPRASEVSLPQRIAYGLEAGAPTIATVKTFASTRTIESIDGGRTQIVFAFPDAAFRDLLALDPRETAEIRLANGRVTQRLLIEVGDVAAARAFLTIRR